MKNQQMVHLGREIDARTPLNEVNTLVAGYRTVRTIIWAIFQYTLARAQQVEIISCVIAFSTLNCWHPSKLRDEAKQQANVDIIVQLSCDQEMEVTNELRSTPSGRPSSSMRSDIG